MENYDFRPEQLASTVTFPQVSEKSENIFRTYRIFL